jgi:capsular polysaccharide biosynthesis protein
VSSYVKLVSSTRVSREVIRDLGLTGTPEAVAGQVSASTAPDSVLIEVAVVGRAPVEVAALADSVGRVFTDLVAELERPSTPDGVAPVVVRVVQPATVPTMPSSPGLPVPLLLGLPGGAAVGAGLALARNAMDTSIRTPEQLHTAVQAPNLGTIAYDGKIPKRPLTVHEDPQSPRAEAFRQLRTNLRAARPRGRIPRPLVSPIALALDHTPGIQAWGSTCIWMARKR